MRRDAFLKSIACLAAAGVLPLPARAAANLKMMIPANPGGGWDTTGLRIQDCPISGTEAHSRSADGMKHCSRSALTSTASPVAEFPQVPPR